MTPPTSRRRSRRRLRPRPAGCRGRGCRWRHPTLDAGATDVASIADAVSVDTDLRIEALNGLLETHSDRVIPLLRDIALDRKNPD